tara:strand:- start:1587 stop:1784 length:198 start_codon:yes stop_codon:yes gene_type:complete
MTSLVPWLSVIYILVPSGLKFIPLIPNVTELSDSDDCLKVILAKAFVLRNRNKKITFKSLTTFTL